MAKSLYSALFDWIVLRINHALLNKKDMEESVPVRHEHIKRCHTRLLRQEKISRTVIITRLLHCFPVFVHRCLGHFWV